VSARARDAELTDLDEKLRAVGAMWGGAEWERLAGRLAPVHEELVRRLAPRSGERWLDVATGTGAVAFLAAREGPVVTGLDLSEPLLERARAHAEREGLPVAFDLGDAQRLPYDDASFDVVSSSFGVIFAPDSEAAAGELARVVRPGGRIGLTTWCPNDRVAAIYERFQRKLPAADVEGWGRRERVEELLGSGFELDISTATWRLAGRSPEELWELMSSSAPPMKAFLGTLDDRRRNDYREAMLEYWESFRTPAGVSEPADYLLVLGTRR
jgi:SAM-dependent methyltransferase